MALHHHDNVDIGGLKMKRVELINDHFSTYFTTVRNLTFPFIPLLMILYIAID